MNKNKTTASSSSCGLHTTRMFIPRIGLEIITLTTFQTRSSPRRQYATQHERVIHLLNEKVVVYCVYCKCTCVNDAIWLSNQLKNSMGLKQVVFFAHLR